MSKKQADEAQPVQPQQPQEAVNGNTTVGEFRKILTQKDNELQKLKSQYSELSAQIERLASAVEALAALHKAPEKAPPRFEICTLTDDPVNGGTLDEERLDEELAERLAAGWQIVHVGVTAAPMPARARRFIDYARVVTLMRENRPERVLYDRSRTSAAVAYVMPDAGEMDAGEAIEDERPAVGAMYSRAFKAGLGVRDLIANGDAEVFEAGRRVYAERMATARVYRPLGLLSEVSQ